MTASVNPVAAGGFSSAASTYARIRPAYARPAIGAIKELCPRDGVVVDLAAGTGILTGQLERAGLRVVGIEPLVAMATQFHRSLPHVAVALGVAEALPIAPDVVDVLTVGQGFHWFDAEAALGEARRVLRPGAALALIWNARDDSTPWVHELTRLVEERTGGRPYDDHRERPWAEVVASAGGFTELTEQRFDNPVLTDIGGVLDRLRSTSFVAALDDAGREALLAEARSYLRSRAELAGRFDYPHETVLYTCRRLPGPS